MGLIRKLVSFVRSWRENLRAQVSKYLVTRQVTKVLSLTHAQELATTPRNEWALVRQRQLAEIKAVQSGQQFDIVDRRSWSYPYLPECLDDSSEILTRDGFKGVKEISKDDLVATLNPETNELQYFHPKKIIRRDFSGKLLHFKGRGFDLMVTPNHRMVGKWTWLNYSDNPELDTTRGKHGRIGLSKTTFATAQEIKDYKLNRGSEYGFEVPFGSKWKGIYPKSYNPRTGRITVECTYNQDDGKRWKRDYNDIRVSLEDYVAFLGIYTAEGGCAGNFQGVDPVVPKYIGAIAAASDNTVYDRDHGYRVSVAQNSTSRHYKKIDKLLKSLPFNFQRENKSKGSWYSNSRALHSQLYECGNTYTKKVPQWVKDLPAKYIQIFLDWFTMGDGIIRPSGGRENFTVSKKLADDLQEMYLKVGNQARVRKGKSSAIGYLTKTNFERLAPKYTIEENIGRFTSLPRPKEVSYTGCVWCVDIPPNATIFVRRGGKGIWTGNSLHRLNQPV